MEVQFKINTDKEDLNELKKLQTWLADIIVKRETAVSTKIEQQKQEALQPKPVAAPVSQPAAPPKKEYSGHGRIVEYDDMSDAMSKIYSGGKC
jgi:hypothetical protein